jgi:hypothetical protein
MGSFRFWRVPGWCRSTRAVRHRVRSSMTEPVIANDATNDRAGLGRVFLYARSWLEARLWCGRGKPPRTGFSARHSVPVSVPPTWSISPATRNYSPPLVVRSWHVQLGGSAIIAGYGPLNISLPAVVTEEGVLNGWCSSIIFAGEHILNPGERNFASSWFRGGMSMRFNLWRAGKLRFAFLFMPASGGTFLFAHPIAACTGSPPS